jgi:hypothetical protein
LPTEREQEVEGGEKRETWEIRELAVHLSKKPQAFLWQPQLRINYSTFGIPVTGI